MYDKYLYGFGLKSIETIKQRIYDAKHAKLWTLISLLMLFEIRIAYLWSKLAEMVSNISLFL